MFIFRALARAFLINRLMQRRQRRYGRPGYGRSYGFFGPPRHRGRVGFFGPMPYYSGRTRRGTRVQVGGCCLPIPLGMLAAALGALGLLKRR
jgi:hypothetical protein